MSQIIVILPAKNRTNTALKRIRNASILESFFAMFVLLLILFCILQLYQIIMAGMVTEYAAFRAARSSSVGFSDYLVDREARVKVIPVSGAMVQPYSSREFGSGQVSIERRAIERYMEGIRYMDYEYWHSDIQHHKKYSCPYYGQVIGQETTVSNKGCTCGDFARGASLSVSQKITGDKTEAEVSFSNYPLSMPLFEIFSKSGNITLSKSAEMTNHAYIFLEE